MENESYNYKKIAHSNELKLKDEIDRLKERIHSFVRMSESNSNSDSSKLEYIRTWLANFLSTRDIHIKKQMIIVLKRLMDFKDSETNLFLAALG